MKIMKSYLAALAVLSVIATPALAQSFDPEFGTGNVVPFQSQPAAPQASTLGHDGLHARAMVPRAHERFNANNPASTGGGSLGYNEMLRIY
jgi:opacity protein-like surface antigen